MVPLFALVYSRWHEVESFADDEGKAIGVNIFFEPYYVKRGTM